MKRAVEHKGLMGNAVHSDDRIYDFPRFAYTGAAYADIVGWAAFAGSWRVEYYFVRLSGNIEV